MGQIVNQCCCSERDKIHFDSSLDDVQSTGPVSQRKGIQTASRYSNSMIEENGKVIGADMSSSEISMKKKINTSKLSISKHSKHNQSITSLAESVHESQRSSRASAYGNIISEFADNAAILIAKQEKKLEWTKVALVNLFEANNQLTTFKKMLDEESIQLYFNDVSPKPLSF